MKKEEFKNRSVSSYTDIRAVRYIPDGEVCAVLQIVHGMQEFIDRYDDFAKYLCSKGYLVTGNDHLGHGGTAVIPDDLGYFAEKDGNEAVLEDVYQLTKITKELYPNKPYFMLGHSMGSFYARQYICKYGNELNAAIIMGTGQQPLLTLKAAMRICEMFALGKGWRYRSHSVNALAFGAYNKRIKNAKTDHDWLTRDDKIVEWYLNEPKCNYVFTLNAFYNMFLGMTKLYDKNLLNNVPKELPLLFTSGLEDPVGDYGNGVEAAAKTLKDVGCRNIDIKLYPMDRHEILNELDKDQVYENLYNWMEEKIKAR